MNEQSSRLSLLLEVFHREKPELARHGFRRGSCFHPPSCRARSTMPASPSSVPKASMLPAALQASAVTARPRACAPGPLRRPRSAPPARARRHSRPPPPPAWDDRRRPRPAPRRRQQARRLAHGSVLALERPQDELVRARGREPLAAGGPFERAHARAVARHPHVLAVGEAPAMQRRLLHGRNRNCRPGSTTRRDASPSIPAFPARPRAFGYQSVTPL